jgi:equilibrative nucleoside transporter 1/2/3
MLKNNKSVIYQKVPSKSQVDNVDHGYLAYMLFLFLGIGSLFPWNAFITASSYFGDRFCNSVHENNYESYFSFFFTVSQTCGLSLAIKYQSVLSFHLKIFWPLVLYSLVFVFTTVMVCFEVDHSTMFSLTLLQCCICGLCGSFLSGGLYGLAALFPVEYTGALMIGSALAGLVVSISSISTTLAQPPKHTCHIGKEIETVCRPFSIDKSALAYFSVASIILFLCILAFSVLVKLPFSQ